MGNPVITKEQFNAWSARLGLGLYWHRDKKNPGTLDLNAGEIKAFGIAEDTYFVQGKPTSALERAVQLIKDAVTGRDPGVLSPAQRALLQQEVARRQTFPVGTDLRADEHRPSERRMAYHILRAASLMEQAYLLQRHPKNLEFAKQVYTQGDPLAIDVFYNSGSPWCEAVTDPHCAALPQADVPPRAIGAHLYPTGFTPADFQGLEKLPNKDDLMSPFAAVEKDGPAGYRAVPFGVHPVLRATVERAAAELEMAAQFAVPPQEANAETVAGWATFRTYLQEVSTALVSNAPRPFDKADEAWVKIPDTFKWGLRIGPDETYWDGEFHNHAGYQANFGLVDPLGEKGLEVFRRYGVQQMEQKLAALIGTDVYAAHAIGTVRLKFVKPAYVGGEARKPFQSLGGFSLPNWGPYAMGSQWVLTGENPITLERQRLTVSTFLGEKYRAHVRHGSATTKIVVHEYFHKLGPQKEFVATLSNGTKMTREEALGGALDAFIEEAKAEVSSYWFGKELEDMGLITPDERQSQAIAGFAWIFSFISRGVHKANGTVGTYQGIAAMMLGHFMEEGAVSYDTARTQWDVDFDKLPDAAAKLLRTLGRIQATGDQAAATALRDHYCAKDSPVFREMIRADEIVATAKAKGIAPLLPRFLVAID